MGRHSPVLAVVVIVWIVLLVVGEEGVELDALLEVLGGLEAADVLEHVKVAVSVDASFDQTVEVDALETDVGVVLLESEVHRRVESDVGSLNGVHVSTSHLELGVVEVFREDLHFLANINLYIYYYKNLFHFLFEKQSRGFGVLGFWGFGECVKILR